MQSHSAEGERICAPLRSTAHYLPIMRHHHERIDGRGYPDHLAGSDIPLGARVVAIADAWDAMVSDRPYRPGISREEAIRLMSKNPNLIKRPVVVRGDQIVLGLDVTAYMKLLK